MAAKRKAQAEAAPGNLVEIYELIDPRDGSVRYIGKANDAAKRLKCHLRDCRTRMTPVYAWIRKLVSLGMTPQIRVVSRITADAWMHEEKRMIFEARLIHPKILNVADGGNEPHCTKEQRQANALKMQNHPNTVAQRRLNGGTNAGKRNPVIHKLLLRLGQDAKYFLNRGNIELHDKMRRSQATLRAMPADRRDAFAKEWVKQKPWFAQYACTQRK